MTNRFARAYHKIRDRLGGRRKLALAVIGIWIAVELIAAAAVVIAGKAWLEPSSARAEDRGTPALGFSASLALPSRATL